MSNTETSIASARASVMLYDDPSKKWIPSGSSTGLSRVHIYQNLQNNTFRVVGRKLQDNEVVINCSILKNLKYNQATPIFHQWRENRQVYGLNFSSKEEADAFAHTMMKVIDLLNQNTYGTTKPVQAPIANSMAQPVYGHIGPPEEYGEMRPQNGWNNNSNNNGHNNHINNIEQNNVMHLNNQQMIHHPQIIPDHMNISGQHIQQNHPSMLPHQQINDVNQNVSQPTYMSSGILMHRNSVSNTNQVSQNQQPMPQQQTIPPPPPPPPPQSTNSVIMSNVSNGSGPVVSTGAPPPPPPPPPTMSNGPRLPIAVNNGQQSTPVNSVVQTNGPTNLAAAIANAKLKRTTSVKEENENNSSQTNNIRSAAPGNLMDEMAKTLARRRAQAESNQNNSQPNENDNRFSGSNSSKESKSSLVNGFSPSKDESNRRNGASDGAINDNDLDRLKQEIMTDVRKELQKMKLDIIEAIKMELNRR